MAKIKKQSEAKDNVPDHIQGMSLEELEDRVSNLLRKAPSNKPVDLVDDLAASDDIVYIVQKPFKAGRKNWQPGEVFDNTLRNLQHFVGKGWIITEKALQARQLSDFRRKTHRDIIAAPRARLAKIESDLEKARKRVIAMEAALRSAKDQATTLQNQRDAAEAEYTETLQTAITNFDRGMERLNEKA